MRGYAVPDRLRSAAHAAPRGIAPAHRGASKMTVYAYRCHVAPKPPAYRSHIRGGRWMQMTSTEHGRSCCAPHHTRRCCRPRMGRRWPAQACAESAMTSWGDPAVQPQAASRRRLQWNLYAPPGYVGRRNGGHHGFEHACPPGHTVTNGTAELPVPSVSVHMGAAACRQLPQMAVSAVGRERRRPPTTWGRHLNRAHGLGRFPAIW